MVKTGARKSNRVVTNGAVRCGWYMGRRHTNRRRPVVT